jgi:predicted phosphodiesterase
LRVQVLSDAHIEFHKDGGQAFIGLLQPSLADVLVIAGDLCLERDLIKILTQLCDLYPHVVMVLGNHAYYGSDRGRVNRKMEKASSRLHNLHWLRDSTTTIDGQRFVGTTLWFSDDPMNAVYEGQLNDFHQIRGFRRWVYQANESAVAFLSHEIGPEDVVVTHHVPTLEAIKPRWRGSELTRFFVCHLHGLILSEQPKLWCFGHTHDSFDFMVGDTRLVCNPFGYARYEENPDFDFRRIIEV